MIRVDRKLNATDVLDALTDLFILGGPPGYIRSDNSPEFIAQKVRDWIAADGGKTAYIEPGWLWENGHCESFNARFKDEPLNGEVFSTLKEAEILIEQWRVHDNMIRPHTALGYRPPAPESTVPMDQRPTMHEHLSRTTRWGHAKFPQTEDEEYENQTRKLSLWIRERRGWGRSLSLAKLAKRTLNRRSTATDTGPFTT